MPIKTETKTVTSVVSGPIYGQYNDVLMEVEDPTPHTVQIRTLQPTVELSIRDLDILATEFRNMHKVMSGLDPETSDRNEHLAKDLAQALPDQKITAIKIYRTATGAGLKEAKEAIEEFLVPTRWLRVTARGSARRNQIGKLIEDRGHEYLIEFTDGKSPARVIVPCDDVEHPSVPPKEVYYQGVDKPERKGHPVSILGQDSLNGTYTVTFIDGVVIEVHESKLEWK